MDQKIFEAELKKEGYEVMTNTTPGAKVNPEHSHPFDVKALVLRGALTLNRDGQVKTKEQTIRLKAGDNKTLSFDFEGTEKVASIR